MDRNERRSFAGPIAALAILPAAGFAQDAVPGDRTPRYVPMMPLTDMGALSTPDSNHRSRKSTALIVSNCMFRCARSGPNALSCPPRRSSRAISFGSTIVAW